MENNYKLKIDYWYTDNGIIPKGTVLTLSDSCFCWEDYKFGYNFVKNNPDIFEKVEPVFEVGKWYQSGFSDKCIIYAKEINDYCSNVIGCGFNTFGIWEDRLICYHVNLKLADMDKVKELMIEEAKRRFPIGCKIGQKPAYDEGIILIPTNDSCYFDKGIENYYYLSIGDVGVWNSERGKWAEVVETIEVKIPKGYKKGKYVCTHTGSEEAYIKISLIPESNDSL